MSQLKNLTKGGPVILPPSGEYALFVDTDRTLKMVDSAGTVTTIGGGGGVNSWDNAILAALQKVNAQIVQPCFPTFDFLEGTLAASRTNQDVTGTGSTVITGTPGGGVGVLVCGAGAGSARFSPFNNKNNNGINGTVNAVPLAAAGRCKISTPATAATIELFASLVAVNESSGEAGFGIVGAASTTNLCLRLSGPGGATQTVVTSFAIPVGTTYFDFAVFWDGARFVAFFGDAVLGTFVPDLTNVLTVLTPISGSLPASMPSVFLQDTAAQTVAVDKFNGWSGVTR